MHVSLERHNRDLMTKTDDNDSGLSTSGHKIQIALCRWRREPEWGAGIGQALQGSLDSRLWGWGAARHGSCFKAADSQPCKERPLSRLKAVLSYLSLAGKGNDHTNPASASELRQAPAGQRKISDIGTFPASEGSRVWVWGSVTRA